MKKYAISLLLAIMGVLLPEKVSAQYQFGYLSYQKALQNMPEYANAQSALRSLKEKYDNEAKYNEEKFQKMFADFLAGQKSFPQEILLKRQKELQVAMEQGISFRKDAERQLANAEQELVGPVVARLDSLLGMIGKENGLIFILNTDNRDFPFIHTQAGKDLIDVVIARIGGKVIPLTEENKDQPQEGQSAGQQSAAATPAPETPAEQK
ncbi:MAG: OmpH family outer membrane protein [Bacteroidaceae bacterium]|nr:OmpH family outer membrane protein [Bacteroidaceae bacterium]